MAGHDIQSRPLSLRGRAGLALGSLVEVVALVLSCLSPWALGANSPGAEFCLLTGVAGLVVIWALRSVTEGSLLWTVSPATLAFAGLFLLGAFQLVSLPPSLLHLLSPNTSRLSADLLPKVQEVLPFGEPTYPVSMPAGHCLSVHPAGSRVELVKLLAMFLLFEAVRNNVGSAASLRRLALAALVNGFLLSLFAFVQYFSSRPGILYWSIDIRTPTFGPFTSRNYYPNYLNLCIGLGLGLLLATRSGSSQPQAGELPKALGPRRERSRRRDCQGRPASAFDILNTPGTVWVLAALGFMAASVFFSLSRGGVVSLAGTVASFVILRAIFHGTSSHTATVYFVLAVVALVFLWLGFDPRNTRLATLWTGEATEDGRFKMWTAMIPAILDYPLFGTGYGSFLYVELAYRPGPDAMTGSYENAHNEYVEALVEGGVLRLALTLVLIAFIYQAGWRAASRQARAPARDLTLGGLAAFTSLVLHAGGDFGIHLGSIAFFGTVLAAHLCAVGRPDDQVDPPARGGVAGTLLSGFGLLVALALGAVLVGEGWRMARVHGFEVGAKAFEGNPDVEAQESRVRLLEQAVRVGPELALQRLRLAQAQMDLYQTLVSRAEKQALAAQVTEVVVGPLPAPGVPAPQVGLVPVAARPLADANRPLRERGEGGILARRYLVPALRHYLVARDLCPLIVKAQLQIAANREWFARADPRGSYLEHARRTLPASSETWYLVGSLELLDGNQKRAWSDWRHSLELSAEYLGPILGKVKGKLSDLELLENVLPARADVVMKAAEALHPAPDAPERVPFLKSALSCLKVAGKALPPEDLVLKARIENALGNDEEAVSSYETALRESPKKAEWRFEYARLLHKRKRLNEARRALQIVLDLQPENSAARRLLEQVAREIVEGK